MLKVSDEESTLARSFVSRQTMLRGSRERAGETKYQASEC